MLAELCTLVNNYIYVAIHVPTSVRMTDPSKNLMGHRYRPLSLFTLERPPGSE